MEGRQGRTSEPHAVADDDQTSSLHKRDPKWATGAFTGGTDGH